MAIDYSKRPTSGGQSGKEGQPGQGGVSLSKVTLTKSAPTVSLAKRGNATGHLRVNLNWTARGTEIRGLFGRKKGSDIDLDLACMYEFTDGTKGIVQALGNAFQSPGAGGAPVIRLDGDDRSGSSTGGENMFIDLAQTQHIRRILVFTFIYQGTPNWAAADAVVTLYPVSGPEIEVRLDESDPRSPSCLIAGIENVDGELVVRREVRYIQGNQSAVDRAYGWGMNWTPGRK